MSKTVNTLSYWMPILQKIKEFQEIAKTEDVELNLLYAEAESVLKNMFIDSSDEYGVSRLEKIIGITPDTEDTLEQRKFRILSRWNDRVPYTDRELYNRLLNLCGEGNFTILENYTEYELDIITVIGVVGGFDETCRILDLMLPCNLVVTISNVLNEIGSNLFNFGVGISTSMHYTVTNDLDSVYSVQMPLNEAMGVATASSRLVTNDLQVSNQITNDAVVSNVVSTGTIISIN